MGLLLQKHQNLKKKKKKRKKKRYIRKQIFHLWGRDLASLWYSSSNESACLKISFGWVWTCLNWKRLWAFHKDHDIIAHSSSYFLSSLYIIWRVSMKKFSAKNCSFAAYPEPKPRCYWQTGTPVVSSCWLQKEHLGSICTFHRVRLDFGFCT